MFQNCTFLPVKNTRGDVDSVCVTLFDATDVGLSQTLLKDALESLKESSNRDGLTGIYNRRYLEQYLSMEFDRARRYGGQFSFILFDFDHFKKINDTFGHLAGDEVLICISRRVSAMLRTTDVLGRYGGEEFGVILSETCIEDARHFAERLRAAVSMELVPYRQLAIPVSVSIGLTQFEPGISSYEQLINNADVALYESKEMGRDRVTCFFQDGVSAASG
jgi:diguanylate cyclase (GGDEF)-like protein